jgi:hypothetical protein
LLVGYDIDDNLHEWPVRLTPREAALFGVGSKDALREKSCPMLF